MVCGTDVSCEDYIDNVSARKSCTELDSHANMVVLGRNSTTLSNTGSTADVHPFSPEYNALEGIKIVDGAVLYTDEYTLRNYILVFENALYIPSMEHNLIPPFIMREAGVQVSDAPKIHLKNPTCEDHSIFLEETELRIPLKLSGILSYISMSKSSDKQLDECLNNDSMLLMTTEGPWNPHSNQYAESEADMLDWEENIVGSKKRTKFVMSDIGDDCKMAISCIVGNIKNDAIDQIIENNLGSVERFGVGQEQDPILVELSSVLD
eukprot:15328352-Ditylum_brightwellii.AAC.2